MDSRFLNVFHDDNKYESDIDYWPNSDESLGLQLTETLHGILPIAPSDNAHDLFGSSLLRDDYARDIKPDPILLQNKNGLMNNDYASTMDLLLKKSPENSSGSADLRTNLLTTVDSDYQFEYESDSSQITSDYDAYVANDFITENNNISCSRSTFRSRTDSSSIADYESHTSDYECDDDNDHDDGHSTKNKLNFSYSLRDEESVIIKPDNFPVDIESLKENGDFFITEEGIELRSDVNTFDLTDFISKDYEHNVIDAYSPIATSLLRSCANHEVQIISSKKCASDSDSDVIVDVETIENDENDCPLMTKMSVCGNDLENDEVEQKEEILIPFVDNIKKDPSWSPTTVGLTTFAEPKTITPKNIMNGNQGVSEANKQTKNSFMLPNKRQCDFLKGKFISGKKNISNCKKGKKRHMTPTASTSGPTSLDQINASPQIEPKLENLQSCIDEKDSNLIKHDRHSIEDFVAPNEIKLIKIKEEKEETVESMKIQPKEPSVLTNVSGKRKLNLEEYKRRRGNLNGIIETKKEENVMDKDNVPKCEQQECDQVINADNVFPKIDFETKNSSDLKAKTEVTSIVKSLKENITPKVIVDPITEAKNKVLRLKERKKAQQIRIIDSTVFSKVGRVTKLPTLIDIVKNASKTSSDSPSHSYKTPTVYEEIVIVSVSCNTDISIPPFRLCHQELSDQTSKNSRSLLKSSALLYKTFNKVQAEDEKLKIASSSLIASIKDVVVKKTQIIDNDEKIDSKEHGEDKIIMHLNKDRLRSLTYSKTTQTDLLPEFLPLPLLERIPNRNKKRKSVRRKYRDRKSSVSDSDFSNYENYEKRSSYHSSRVGLSPNQSPSAHRRHSSHNKSRRNCTSTSSSSESEQNSRHHSYNRRTRKYSTSSSELRISRSRSRSSVYKKSRSRSRSLSSSRSRCHRQNNRSHAVDRNVSVPAVEERRIVYIGRIEPETNKEVLRRKFISYGPIKQITIHYKDSGVKYGFVTFERSEDAFTVIDSSSRDQNINMYDISFGGRRVFCRATYADLDDAGVNTYQSYAFPPLPPQPKEEDSFETLLLKVKEKLSAAKSSSNNNKM